jgi:hypothetical protein
MARSPGNRKALCHPGKKHYGLNLCEACYKVQESRKWREARKAIGFPYRTSTIPKCHPDKPYQAKGLCVACYTKLRRVEIILKG